MQGLWTQRADNSTPTGCPRIVIIPSDHDSSELTCQRPSSTAYTQNRRDSLNGKMGAHKCANNCLARGSDQVLPAALLVLAYSVTGTK